MLEALVIGIFTASLVTLAVAAFGRAPTRVRCPECNGSTELVMLPPLLRRNQFVHMRWCPSCSWEGLGRNGPEWIPGRRLAHRSGFHWGGGRFRADFGFQFRRPESSGDLPPHHPSGFRFAGDPAARASSPDHPSGFRFGAKEGTPQAPVFRWGQSSTAEDFRFKGPDNPKKSGPGGFNWKGVA